MIIQTHQLNYSFRKNKPVLRNLSLNVPEKSIYGFLGPNGAGKSTTIRLITNLLAEQEEGQVELFGKKIQEQIPGVFKRIGSIIETPTLYAHLTGFEHLKYVAALQGIKEPKYDEIFDTIGLSHAKNIKSKRYSLGMKQRLSIGMALLNEPELLILDEPVNGLDPQGIVEVRLLLQKLNKEKGITIFVSSHLLGEIEKLCTHVGIINNGELKYEGTLEELKQQNLQSIVLVQTLNAEEQIIKIRATYPNAEILNKETIRLGLDHSNEIPAFNAFLVENNVPVYQLQKTGGLEEWFIKLTNQIRQI